MQFTLFFTTLTATSASAAASSGIYTQVNSSPSTSKKPVAVVPHAFWHQHKSVPASAAHATSAASSAASPSAIYTQVNSFSPTSKKPVVPHAFWHQHKSTPADPTSAAHASLAASSADKPVAVVPHAFWHQRKSTPVVPTSAVHATSTASPAASSNAINTQVNSSPLTSKKPVAVVPHAFWHQHKAVPVVSTSAASPSHVRCHQTHAAPSLSSVHRSQKATARHHTSKLRGSKNTDIVDILKQDWNTIIIIGAVLVSIVCLALLKYIAKITMHQCYKASLNEEDLEQGMYQPLVSGKPVSNTPMPRHL